MVRNIRLLEEERLAYFRMTRSIRVSFYRVSIFEKIDDLINRPLINYKGFEGHDWRISIKSSLKAGSSDITVLSCHMEHGEKGE